MEKKKSNWRAVRIDQIGKVVTGHTPPKKITEYYGDEYVWIKPTDIEIGKRYVADTEEKYSKKAYEKYKSSLLLPFSTSVTTIGTVGKKICLTREPCFTNQSINTIIPHKDQFDPMFVYYLMKSNLDVVEQRNPGTASGRHHVSKSNFSSIELEVPDLPSQKIIGWLLCTCDDLIENYSAQINILKEVASLVYYEWFVALNFPEYEKTEFVNSELGNIPQGWKIEKLNNVYDIFSGGTPSTKNSEYWDGEIPWLSSGETRNDFILETEKTITKKGVENSSTRLAKKGDVIIASAGQGNTRGQVSLCLIDTYINQSVVVLRSKNTTMYSTFLFYNLKSRYEELRSISDSSSSRGSLPQSLLKSFEILLPKENILAKFHSMIRPMIDVIENYERTILSLTKIRDVLLTQLLSKQINVLELGIKIPEQRNVNIF